MDKASGRKHPPKRSSGAPRDGLTFAGLGEAMQRAAYFETFAALLPAKIVPHFHRHAASAELADLRASLYSHLASVRPRRIA